MSITNEELVEQLEPWRKSLVRPAWVPKIGIRSGRSHFGGAPSLPAGEQWPNCPNCQKTWQLFLQLDLGDLPEELASVHGPGLLQFFYCVEEDCEQMEGWSPHAIGHGFFVQTNDDLNEAAIPSGHKPFTTKHVESWDKIEDYPAPQDHEENGLTWDFDFSNNVVNISCKPLNLEFKNLPMEQLESESVSEAESGDKLGGWPDWVQGDEWVDCRKCGERMDMLFQLSSENNDAYMWGDMGVGHISRCRNHKDEWAFGWACG